MRLDTPFVRLPLTLDADRLAVEAAAFPVPDWRPEHPTPYLRQVLAALRSVVGRTRLVRATDSAPAPDPSSYAMQRARVIVPVADVRAVCGGEELTLRPGELWVIDTWRTHHVAGTFFSIDTVGSAEFWDMVAASDTPDTPVAFDPSADPPLLTEAAAPPVLSPWEIECLFAELSADLADLPAPELFSAQLAFLRGWRNLWAAHGSEPAGWAGYRELLAALESSLAPLAGKFPLPNGLDAVGVVLFWTSPPEPLARSASEGPATRAKIQGRLTDDSLPVAPPVHEGTGPSLARRANTPETDMTVQPDAAPAAAPLRSVFTTGLADLLSEFRVSLLVSTYQAGKLVIVRSAGGKLNTHFRDMHSPMGLAVSGNRLAVGAKNHVWEFHDQPEVAAKLDPPGTHDACFLPRVVHTTGDIRIHEIDFAGDELWVVNTRFSCLCTLDRKYSFVPRWRPTFITALAAEDRCHLNGLCITGDPPRPRYVTCLGATDTAGGWRANKRDGGLLLDVDSHEVIAHGLSMPHSPRMYDGKLWLLESGVGGLGYLDPKTGHRTEVARLPGFTRGLDFVGPLAFVGLSQVRETAAFSGLPITELPAAERRCGVWVVDWRTGRTVGFLRFEEGVQEIFAVHALAGVRYPEVLTDDDDWLANSFVLPDDALRELLRG